MTQNYSSGFCEDFEPTTEMYDAAISTLGGASYTPFSPLQIKAIAHWMLWGNEAEVMAAINPDDHGVVLMFRREARA